MRTKISGSLTSRAIDVNAVAERIAMTQRETGEIPWCDDKKTDPWDHVEAAMGLSVAGYLREARLAFDWLAQNQRDDGSWYASYMDGRPEDRTLDTNMTSYVAVGVFHHYLITADRSFLKELWGTVEKAIEFALGLQAPEGEIHWAISPMGRKDPMALLTGSSSVFMSVKCALAIADELGYRRPAWREALGRLGEAIRTKPHLFNVAKSRYSMDWFYPILSGALTGEDARGRLEKHWKKFVVKGLGVRCVSDHPWITIAETSELSLALCAMGNRDLAEIVFGWIEDRTYEDGSYWCGFTFPDMVIWPEDRLTWTNAVVLMALDALESLTPAHRLFDHDFWAERDRSSAVGVSRLADRVEPTELFEAEQEVLPLQAGDSPALSGARAGRE